MEKKLDASILALGSKIINAEIKMQTLKKLLIEKEIVLATKEEAYKLLDLTTEYNAVLWRGES